MAPVTALVSVSDNQYWIHGDTFDVGDWGYTGFNGLVAPLALPGVPREPGEFAVVMTGTGTGLVRLTLDVADRDPGPPDLDAWDEVVEVSLDVPGGVPGVSTGVEDDESHLLPDLPTGAGPLRLRVHARGRDRGQEELVVDGEPVEEHLIQVWPAPAAPTAVRKTGDAYGAGFRTP
ncbi:hypothetical protein [Streptomyces sp. NPDC001380]|uniref:hypothetical protein n=1 Tax=Streptomyces sp. NPDC001380 TaxID=3364566 RepID=UPI0036CD01DF